MCAAVDVGSKSLGMPNDKSGPGVTLVGHFETNAQPSDCEGVGGTDRSKPLWKPLRALSNGHDNPISTSVSSSGMAAFTANL